MDFKDIFATGSAKVLGISKKDILHLIEVPPNQDLGNYALPCFTLSKQTKKKPSDIATILAEQFKEKGIIKIVANGPYANAFVDPEQLAKHVLTTIHKQKKTYGTTTVGKGKTIVIDYSSPNIAKPFGIGHLRSTVIGHAIRNILHKQGYTVVGVNHIGDWGTQFGKLIVAHELWGDAQQLEKEPINHLLSIYVKFHEEAKINPQLEDDARKAFKELEEGNKQRLKQWEIFKKLSLEEFKKYYEQLNVSFDSYHGEAFYNDKLESAITTLQKKVKTVTDDGALIVDLEQEKMPPFILKKTDGASTYHTRDLAAALYRLKTYKPHHILYVVGSPQKLHFNQLFTVLQKMGTNKETFIHVDFGHFLGMSTRKGNIIFLEEVLDKAIALAEQTIEEKNPDLPNKKTVAQQIGIGAVIFADLRNDRVKDAVFDWKKFITFDGETAPYIQYTHARCCSILKKAPKLPSTYQWKLLTSPEEQALINHLSTYEDTIAQAAQQYKPSIIARYLLDLCALFNTFYTHHKVLGDNKEQTAARLLLVSCTKTVIASGLTLLGIHAPEAM